MSVDLEITGLAGLVTTCVTFTSDLNSLVKMYNAYVFNDCICFLLFNSTAIGSPAAMDTILIAREKEGLRPMTKSLITTENSKTNGQHKNANKKLRLHNDCGPT